MEDDLLPASFRTALIAVAVGLSLGALLLTMRARRKEATHSRTGAVVCWVALVSVLCGLGVAWLVGIALQEGPDSVEQYNDSRWVLLAPWSRPVLWLGGAAALAVPILAVVATNRVTSLMLRAALIFLRAGAATSILILFLEPALELRQVARQRNHIAVVVDASESMNLVDNGDETRFQLAQRVVSESAEALGLLGVDHKVDYYRFSSDLQRVERAELLTSTPPRGATLLRKALEDLRGRYRGSELAGVLLISDGVATGDLASNSKREMADFAAELDAPIHTTWVGQDGLRDISVAAVSADEFAFVRTATRVEGTIRVTGYPKGQVQVTLSSDGRALRRKWVDVPASGGNTSVFFEFTPTAVGKYVYEISTPVRNDEAVDSNNAKRFVVRVIRDKVRVLQVAGRPSWDVRALRGILKQDPNTDLISFFILRTQDDIGTAGNDELSLIPFPTRELFSGQLPSFDLVVLQNFDYGPYGIGQYLENIRAYVHDGGGLVMLGGDLSFASGGYANTPIAKVLPVTLPDVRGSQELTDTRPFKLELSESGTRHPVTALRYERDDNLERWRGLPPLEGINLISGVKKNATVLATHPVRRLGNGAPHPVLVAGSYGEGRVLAVLTDSLWQWSFAPVARQSDNRDYLNFWKNTIRWMIQDPDLRYLHVESDRVEYEPGRNVMVRARLVSHDYAPAEGKIAVRVERGFDPNRAEFVAEFDLATNPSGTAEHTLSELAPGTYRIAASAKVDGQKIQSQDIFLVRESTAETEQPEPSAELLALLAAASGGTHVARPQPFSADLSFREPRVVRVDRRRDVELWSRPWILLAGLVFLGLEWTLRKRSGTL